MRYAGRSARLAVAVLAALVGVAAPARPLLPERPAAGIAASADPVAQAGQPVEIADGRSPGVPTVRSSRCPRRTSSRGDWIGSIACIARR